MKLKLAPPRRHDDENLIPLINIVFLLLVFFMLAGTFVQAGRFEVIAPRSLSTAAVEERQLRVLLAADGRLAVGEREMSAPQLRHLISTRLSEQPDLQVQLQADRQLRAARLIEILQIFRAAGVAKLMLLTEPDDA